LYDVLGLDPGPVEDPASESIFDVVVVGALPGVVDEVELVEPGAGGLDVEELLDVLVDVLVDVVVGELVDVLTLIDVLMEAPVVEGAVTWRAVILWLVKHEELIPKDMGQSGA